MFIFPQVGVGLLEVRRLGMTRPREPLGQFRGAANLVVARWSRSSAGSWLLYRGIKPRQYVDYRDVLHQRKDLAARPAFSSQIA